MPGDPRTDGRPLGVRVRVTAVATCVVAIALVIGALALWFVVRLSLYGGLREGATQDASAISSQIEEGAGAGFGELDDDRLLQVIDADGTIVARSEGAPPRPVTSVTRPASTVQIGGTTYVVAVEQATGDRAVIAGRPTATADATLAAVAVALIIGVPVLVSLVAAVTWAGVGRSLAPVERLRRQVGEVTSRTLGRRVDEPGTRDEIDRLASTLNDMLARLDLASASQRRFISDASHELKSPLTTLRQYAELARDHPDRVDQAELSAAVLSEGARMEELVQGLLLLAKADEAALSLHAREVDLDDVLLGEAARLRALGTVTTDATRVGAARVIGDPALLRQLVRNLIDNAARHARSRVALSSREEGDHAVITISDDGPGIPESERLQVLERFVRLDAGRAREEGGSGLGLAIVDEIARAHHGRVWIDADPELGGARLIVELPVGPSDPQGSRRGQL